jgi:hypothetical protein
MNASESEPTTFSMEVEPLVEMVPERSPPLEEPAEPPQPVSANAPASVKAAPADTNVRRVIFFISILSIGFCYPVGLVSN